MRKEELFQIATETDQRCLEILKAKNSDYAGQGEHDDALKNFKAVEHFNITDSATGLMVRMSDKFCRLCNVYRGGAKVKDESVIDTIEDLINYLKILKAILKEKAGIPQKNA